MIYDQNYTFPQRDIYTGRARWTAAMSNQNILAVTKVPQRPLHFFGFFLNTCIEEKTIMHLNILSYF